MFSFRWAASSFRLTGPWTSGFKVFPRCLSVAEFFIEKSHPLLVSAKNVLRTVDFTLRWNSEE